MASCKSCERGREERAGNGRAGSPGRVEKVQAGRRSARLSGSRGAGELEFCPECLEAVFDARESERVRETWFEGEGKGGTITRARSQGADEPTHRLLKASRCLSAPSSPLSSRASRVEGRGESGRDGRRQRSGAGWTASAVSGYQCRALTERSRPLARVERTEATWRR